jgi:hypothetical protein
MLSGAASVRRIIVDVRELANLDLEGAKELMIAFATDAKRIEKEVAEARQALALWKSRVTLAESKGMADLVLSAKAQAGIFESRIASLQSERAAMERDAEQIRQALPGIQARSRSIDPDRLLAELQMVTGELLEPEAAKAEQGIRKLELASGAEDALTALKRKMGLAPPAAPSAAPAADKADTPVGGPTPADPAAPEGTTP